MQLFHQCDASRHAFRVRGCTRKWNSSSKDVQETIRNQPHRRTFECLQWEIRTSKSFYASRSGTDGNYIKTPSIEERMLNTGEIIVRQARELYDLRRLWFIGLHGPEPGLKPVPTGHFTFSFWPDRVRTEILTSLPGPLPKCFSLLRAGPEKFGPCKSLSLIFR